MADLDTTRKLDRPDEVYQILIDMHDGCTDKESRLRNAKLILCLANHIGDENIISQAVAIATKTSPATASTSETDK